MPFKILVVDDNLDVKHDEISKLPEMLRAAGYEVVITPDGVAAYDLVLEYKPDLVVLAIQFKNQPVDGFEICEAIRQNENIKIPIILITSAMKESEDILRGFEAGADDYVVRHRDNREILARIRANLPPEVLIINDYLCVDLAGFQVFVKRAQNWQKVHLPPLEFELLKVLIMNDGLVMLTTSLKNKIWGDKLVSDDVLTVYIRRLREKIEPNPAHPVYIETIEGFGYRFNGKQTRVGDVDHEKRIVLQVVTYRSILKSPFPTELCFLFYKSRLYVRLG
jgi:two-component system, OmpR family, alkaline phosphatase synthesis response regulator PhoP